MKQTLKDLGMAVICTVVTLGGFISVTIAAAWAYGWRPGC